MGFNSTFKGLISLKVRIACLFRYVLLAYFAMYSPESKVSCMEGTGAWLDASVCGVNEAFFSLLNIAQRWLVVTDVSGQPVGPVFLDP